MRRVPADDPGATFEDLRDHLVRSSSLSPSEARRVIADVLDYFDEDVRGFVRRRHAELQSQGSRNPDAFERIAAEMRERRFAATEHSLRQLRRIVYT